MIFIAAPTSRAIKVVTTCVLALALAFVAGGLLEKHLPLAGLFVGLVALICYLLAPVAYDTTDGQLTVLPYVTTDNRIDGTVEVLAEGPEPKLGLFLAYLKRGPLGARVSSVAEDWSEARGAPMPFQCKRTE